ncbi:MAG: hypothetical protein WC261_08630 [Synergistaceae bacterium]|jgi:hypothetical protein
MKNRITVICVSLVIFGLLIYTLAATDTTDVIGKRSIGSFNAVLSAMPENVAEDGASGGWAITSPGGERFIWSRSSDPDMSYDLTLEFDSKPFLDAGLNADMLPEGMVMGEKIVIVSALDGGRPTDPGAASPLELFREIVRSKREYINYHAALDHFGIKIGNGNAFEWAKDIGTNDKDIVFVLDPAVFMDAGVDPSKLEGWLYAKVKTMDESGKPVEVYKFLKPYNIGD